MIRFARQVFRLSLLKRFSMSLREDGLRTTLLKTRDFIGKRFRGEGATALSQAAPDQSQGQGTYLRSTWQDLAKAHGFHIERDPATPDQKFIAIVGDLNLPQCRKYRVEQLAEFLRSHGIECDFAHYQDLPRVVALLSRATHLIEYRLQSSALTEMLRYEARRLQLPILYDIDDPLFSVSAYETYGNMAALDPGMKAHFVSEAPKYLSMMNGADALCVATPGLAEHAKMYTERPIFVRRNFADDVSLTAGRSARDAALRGDDLFRVVFSSGSQGHEVDFATIAPTLTAFLGGGANRRLLILGHFDPSHIPASLADKVETKPFTDYEAYLSALAQADCAVMPLADDIFNRCKSAVRVIDAASVGLPSIVGTVGDLPNMVRDGQTGFVATTPDDWMRALTTLADDRAAATAMGAAARADLEDRWQGHAADHIILPEMMDWLRS